MQSWCYGLQNCLVNGDLKRVVVPDRYIERHDPLNGVNSGSAVVSIISTPAILRQTRHFIASVSEATEHGHVLASSFEN